MQAASKDANAQKLIFSPTRDPVYVILALWKLKENFKF